MKTNIFLITALLTAGLSAQAQSEQMVEAVSPSKQAELPLQNCPKLVIGTSQLTFTDNVTETKFSADERIVIRLKKTSGVGTGIANLPVKVGEQKSATYNLAGQRVTDAAKGLIIKNGRKYIRK